MPVVLDGPAAEHAWMDPDVDLEAAVQLAAPLPDGQLHVYPISPRVNSSRNEGLDLLERVEPTSTG
jgi:putative SOS response-associated peptidase YedK